MTCEERNLVDAHFAGTIVLGDERRMRSHLDDCEPCRAHYRKRQLLSLMVPEAPTAEERIGRPLGFGKKKRVFSLPLPLAAAALALAALMFFVIRSPKDDGFTPRGSIVSSTAPASKIAVYRANADSGAVVLASGSVRAGDELAFSYDNASNKPYLMIFGVDDTGRVYWFYPAWTNETENPMALKIEPGKSVQLPEAIRHPLAGERLTIHGLFLETPQTVRDVETALRDGRLDGGMQGAVDHVLMFEVGR